MLSNWPQQSTRVCFCSRVSWGGAQRAHTFLMFSLLCKILKTVLLVSFAEPDISATVIFLSWSMIFFTFASLHAEDGRPDLGRSATWERPHLNCKHQFFTEAYEGQTSSNTGSISLCFSVSVFPCNIKNFITVLASDFSFVLTNRWMCRSGQ